MKHRHPMPHLRIFAAILAGHVLTNKPGRAATLFWDVNGPTAGFSTVVGTWNGINAFWNTDATGGAGGAVGAAATSADDLIIPQATTNTGNLTVSGAQSASSITFAPNVGPTCTITGGTSLTIGGSGSKSGIFGNSTGANTVTSPVILNAAVNAFNFTNTSAGLLTVGAVTGSAASGSQMITLGSSSYGGITLNGIIGNGAGGGNVALTVYNISTGVTTLGGANTYTGTTTVNAGTLALSGGGVINSTNAIALNGGNLSLVNTAQNHRVADGAAINSTGGTITYTNTSGANIYTETIGTITLSAGALDLVEATAQASTGSQTLTLTGLSQTNQAVATFSATTTGPQASGSKNMIVVSGAGTTTADQIIGPWATLGTAPATQTDYAVYNANYVVPAGIAASDESMWMNSTNAYTLNAGTILSGTRTITALRYSGGAGALGLGENDYKLETYGLLNGGSGLLTVSTTGTGTLTTPAGGGNLFLTTGNNAITVSAPISDNSGTVNLVKSGASTLTLAGTNTYSGTTTINAGTLVATGPAALPGYDSPNQIVFNGGTLQIPVGDSGWATGDVDTLLANASKTRGTLALDTTSGDLTQTATTPATLGALGLTKVGSNTLTLNQANTFTGRTTVAGGTLLLAHPDAISSSAGLILGNGTTLALRGDTASTFNTPLTSLVSGATTTIDMGNLFSGSGQQLSLGSPVLFANNISGTIHVTGSNNYALRIPTLTIVRTPGNVSNATINATRDVQIDKFRRAFTAGNPGGNGALYLTGTSTGSAINGFELASEYSTAATWLFVYKQGNGSWTWGASNLGQPWALFQVEAGTLRVTGTIDMALGGGGPQGFRLNGGVLAYNAPGAIKTGNTAPNIYFNGGNLDQTSGAPITTSTYNPGMQWNADFTFLGSNGANSDLNMGTGAVSLGTTTGTSRTVTILNTAATLTVGGAIGDGITAKALTKAGPGTLRLTGANSHTGGTTVSAGTLLVNGSLPTAGTVTVSGGTLGGTGTLNGPVSVQSGGTVNPGASTGVLTASHAGGMTISGKLVIDIDDFQTPLCDKLSVTAGLLTLSSGSTLEINVTGTPMQTEYVIATYSSLSGTFGTTSLPLGYTINYAYGGNQIALVRDTAAPTPDPLTWAVAPAGLDATSVIMTATTATDPTPSVLYYFENTTNSNTSGWIFNTSWTDTGLFTGTTYSYRVKARDGLGNETGWSAVATATPQASDTTPPAPSPMTWAIAPAGLTPTSIKMTATTATDPTPPVQYYFEGTTNGHNSGWISNTSWTDAGLTAGQTYGYRVKARDGLGNQTEWSATANAVAQTETNPPTPNPMTWAVQPAMQDATTATMTATAASDDYNNPVQYLFENTTNSQTSGWISSTSWTETGLTTFQTYSYRVKARDAVGNETAWAAPVPVYLGAYADGSWTVDASGNWGTPANWATTPAGFVADGLEKTASLTNDISADRLVTMNGTSRTLGVLNVGDADGSARYTLAATGGATLTLDNGPFVPMAINQTDTSAGDTLDGSLPILVTGGSGEFKLTNAGTNPLTVNGPISSTTPLTKAGHGPVVLGGANSLAGMTTVSQGPLQLTNIDALGSSTALRLANGTTLELRSDTAAMFNTPTTSLVSGSTTTIDVDSHTSGSGQQLSLGSPVLFANNVSGTIKITGFNDYSLRIPSITHVRTGGGDSTVTLDATNDVQIDKFRRTFVSGGGNGALYLKGTSTGSAVNGFELASEHGTAATWLFVYKQGNGSWTWGASNLGQPWALFQVEAGTLRVTGTIDMALGGGGPQGFRLNGGVLAYNAPGAIKTGNTAPNIYFNGGNLDQTSGAPITTSTYNPGMQWNADFTFLGSNGANSDLYLGNGAVVMSATRTVTIRDAAATLNLGGVIAGSGCGLTKEGPGTLKLGGAGTYTGPTTVNEGTLAMTGATQTTSAIAVSASGTLGLDIASPVTASEATVSLDGSVLVTGTPTLVSHTLLTASSISGTPVLSPAVPGYTLVVDGGNTLKLNATGGDYDDWAAKFPDADLSDPDGDLD
ncbi:MAG: autotransporter-associated beta strand repeat-containing protein, partial [Luteolibacter sp.]